MQLMPTGAWYGAARVRRLRACERCSTTRASRSRARAARCGRRARQRRPAAAPSAAGAGPRRARPAAAAAAAARVQGSPLPRRRATTDLQGRPSSDHARGREDVEWRSQVDAGGPQRPRARRRRPGGDERRGWQSRLDLLGTTRTPSRGQSTHARRTCRRRHVDMREANQITSSSGGQRRAPRRAAAAAPRRQGEQDVASGPCRPAASARRPADAPPPPPAGGVRPRRRPARWRHDAAQPAALPPQSEAAHGARPARGAAPACRRSSPRAVARPAPLAAARAAGAAAPTAAAPAGCVLSHPAGQGGLKPLT